MKNYSKNLSIFSLVAISAVTILPVLSSSLGLADAFAQQLDASASVSSNSLNRVMCNALRIVTGGAGKTFAAFAVIATGIGFFTGKVSWGLMIGVAAGIATMFGASSIVAAISGESVNTMCNNLNIR
jgi:type IV secretory pathway VirB2 component (pilin)